MRTVSVASSVYGSRPGPCEQKRPTVSFGLKAHSASSRGALRRHAMLTCAVEKTDGAHSATAVVNAAFSARKVFSCSPPTPPTIAEKWFASASRIAFSKSKA